MFQQQSRYARVTRSDLASIEQRMHDLEKRLARMTNAAGRASAGVSTTVSDTAERISDLLVSALTDISGRFRGGARSVGDEAARLRQDAARFGSEALSRLSTEVEHRPLVLLAVAAGVGLLVGLAAAASRR